MKYFEELYEELSNTKTKEKRDKILTDSSTQYPIENTYGINFQYLMDIYCGSEAEKMSITFDTGSAWTIL